MSAIMHNDQKIALKIESVKLGDGKLVAPVAGASPYAIAHLPGTAAVKFGDTQRVELKKFVDGGGTLVIDAAGGSSSFAAAIEQAMTDTFGADADQLRRPLDLESPIYKLRDRPLTQVHYRAFASNRLGTTTSPRLRGIVVGGRLAVVYSQEDLSAGLVGQEVDGICGYAPASATQIMTQLLLYAAH